MLMLQNSVCTRSQKLFGMLRCNHRVAPHFWRWSSISNGGQVELGGQLEVLLVLLVLLPLLPLGGGGPREGGGVRLVPWLPLGGGGPGEGWRGTGLGWAGGWATAPRVV